MSAAKTMEEKYPAELKNIKLEYAYIGLLLENPKSSCVFSSIRFGKY